MTLEALTTKYGTMYVPDNDQGQYWWLKNIEASPEDAYIELVCKLLDERPQGIAVDVGANFGCWTLPLVKSAREVIAFEPQRPICAILKSTIEANRLTRVQLFNLAVGAKPGEILVPDMSLDEATNFGGVSLGAPHLEQPDAPMRSCGVVTLDDFVRRSGHVSFIKADVEGAETEVLTGAWKLIARDRPILFVEALHPKTDTPALAAFIRNMGYEIEQHLDNFLAMPL